ncbi:hypothetical protein AUK10_01670 [Candidatus Gracilibacteria bacterium CG2_30_37_12]|nr:MAG: hypothetical protein AUK10_01670 [Candidatus Gracilibacteria bacterium CG2_30_37_12]
MSGDLNTESDILPVVDLVLKGFREEIDAIDPGLIGLLHKRFVISQGNKTPVDVGILFEERKAWAMECGLDPDWIESFWKDIFSWMNIREGTQKIDKDIMNCLLRRFVVVEKVGKYKAEKNMPPLQPKRWEEVLETRKSLARERGLDEEWIEIIWNTIHKYACEVEERCKKSKFHISDCGCVNYEVPTQVVTILQ